MNLIILLLLAIGNSASLTVPRQTKLKLSPQQTKLLSSRSILPCDTMIGEVTEEKRQMDKLIIETAIPAMLNLAIVPLVSAVETMWIGRMGDALSLAGQSAASTAFLTCFYLLSFLPTIAAPMVAAAYGAKKHNEVRKKISETLSLCNFLGLFGMILLASKPDWILQLVLKADAPAMKVAVPYLRLRAMSMIPSLISATSFAAFRGTLDTKTPLMISSVANLLKLLLDPLFILKSPLKAAGATLATFFSESFASLVNFRVLSKRNMIDRSLAFKLPTNEVVAPLLTGGTIMMVRQVAINICTLATSRYAQSIDENGIAAAAFGIVTQIYTIGFVVHVAMQGAAAAIIPVELAKNGKQKAQRMADRLFLWSVATGCALGLLQAIMLPYLIPLFTTLPEIREAVKVPALISSILHVVNGPRFVGEGQMMGLGSFRDLTVITCLGTLLLVGSLRSPLGTTLEGVMLSNLLFCGYQTVSLVLHYLFFGKLRRRKTENTKKGF